MACQGQTLPIAQYSGLFSMIGTEFGGDGRIHFKLPKLATIAEDGGTEPLNYYMNVSSAFENPGSIYDMGIGVVGEIGLLGATYNPINWLECNGQALSTTKYDTLFYTIGHTYGGEGDTFNLPNIPKLPSEGSDGKVSVVIRAVGGITHGHGTLGVITRFAGGLPSGGNFMACDGSELKIHDYPALYSILGTVYGGDGKTTFNLPTINTGDDSIYIICVNGTYPYRN